MSDDMPIGIKELVARCDVGEVAFDNDDMSKALSFGESLWLGLTLMAERYERMSGYFMPGDIRGPMMAQAAKDMRDVLSDTKQDATR